jgi:hypothetical protein
MPIVETPIVRGRARPETVVDVAAPVIRRYNRRLVIIRMRDNAHRMGYYSIMLPFALQLLHREALALLVVFLEIERHLVTFSTLASVNVDCWGGGLAQALQPQDDVVSSLQGTAASW